MKKTIILLLLAFSSFFCQANTDSLPIYELDAVDKLVYQNHVQENALQVQQTKRAGILGDFLQFATSLVRPVWGKYDEPGYRKTGHTPFFNITRAIYRSRLFPSGKKYWLKTLRILRCIPKLIKTHYIPFKLICTTYEKPHIHFSTAWLCAYLKQLQQKMR